MRRSASSSNSKRRWRGSGCGEGGDGEESPLLRGDVVSFLLSFTDHSTLSFRALAVAWAS